MKPSFWIVSATTLLIALAACEKGSESSSRTGGNRYGYQGNTTAQTQFATPTPEPTATPFAEPTPDPALTTAPSPTPDSMVSTTTRDIQYGTPVPGKPGFVTSPHAPYAGYVDVRGFPPGTEVKCPYTSKIFLVP